MNRNDRFKLFLRELMASAPAANALDARNLLAGLLLRIEDEHSGAPYCPDNWMHDGRMYPPDDDYERESPHADVRVFRTRGHFVHFARNGAIRIVEILSRHIVIDLAGADGATSPY